MNKILITMICAAQIAASSCDSGNKAATQEVVKKDSTKISTSVHLNDDQIKSVGIITDNPSLEDISGTITLQGSITSAPESNVSLSFPIGGYIRSTHVLLGKSVRKGQVLATIEDLSIIQLQQDYLSAITNRDLAETEFARQQDLNRSKATSDRVFQQARAALDQERILVSSLAQKLQLIGIDPAALTIATIKKEAVVRAPINGFIAKINVSVGKYTAPTDVLFEIIDPSSVYLSLKVFEKDMDKIKVGEELSAYAPSEGDRRYAAKIVAISRNFDENRMADILCKFDQPNRAIVPGMFMNADIRVDHIKSLVVHEDAVVRWQNKFYVFEEKSNGIFQRVEVSAGVGRDGKQQIINKDLSEDSRIVMQNAFALLMKLENSEE